MCKATKSLQNIYKVIHNDTKQMQNYDRDAKTPQSSYEEIQIYYEETLNDNKKIQKTIEMQKYHKETQNDYKKIQKDYNQIQNDLREVRNDYKELQQFYKETRQNHEGGKMTL